MWGKTHAFVEQITLAIEQGNDLTLQDARPVIRECVESIKANASAMFWMSRIKSRDAYTDEQLAISHPLPDGAFGISLEQRVQQLITGHRVYPS